MFIIENNYKIIYSFDVLSHPFIIHVSISVLVDFLIATKEIHNNKNHTNCVCFFSSKYNQFLTREIEDERPSINLQNFFDQKINDVPIIIAR